MGLPLGVGLQALGAATAERIFQDEVEGEEVRHLVALDAAAADLAEVLLHALGRGLLAQDLPDLRRAGDEPDVARISLVAGAGLGDLVQSYLHVFLRRRRATVPARARAPATTAAVVGRVAIG